MNKRILFIFLSLLIVFFMSFVYVFVRDNTNSKATCLASCQNVPPNLPEGLRHLYRQIACSTNVKDRERGMMALSHNQFQSPEMAAFLPLLSEIMATDDYVASDFRRFHMAWHAGEKLAFAGVDAVPFFRKALQSNKTVEIQAGLSGILKLNSILTGKTNEWRAACITLLPYVHMQTTNNMAETPQEVRAFLGRISGRAQFLESVMQRSLPPASSK